MKTINLFFLLTLVLSINLKSQSNNYDVDLSMFEGTWIGNLDQDTLIIKLEIVPITDESLNLTIDSMFGNYEFISDSNIELDSNILKKYNLKNGRILETTEGSKYLFLLLYDNVIGKNANLSLKLLPDTNELEWSLKNRERIFINAERDEIDNWRKFSVPTEMTLVKVNK
ncbi:MAG: DUF6705 family protein [Balneola sp.]